MLMPVLLLEKQTNRLRARAGTGAFIELKLELGRFPRWDRRRGGMPPSPDFATARFVLCCIERGAAVVLSRQQNAILHRGRYKRGSSRRQERTRWETLIVRP